MAIPLRLLIIESSEEEALLGVCELQKAGYDPVWDRVDSAEAFAEKLASGPWDLILSTFTITMSGFGGLEALAMVRQKDPDLPFLLVSKGIGEEAAVQAIKAGACDCILKEHLDRLPAAVDRELKDAELRRSKRVVEAGLRQKISFYNDMIAKARDGIVVTDLQARIKDCNQSFLDIIGVACVEDARGRSLLDITAPEDRERELALVREQAFKRGYTDIFEKEYIRPDGRRIPVSVRIRLRRDVEGEPIETIALARDIAEEKTAKRALEESARLHRLLTENSNDVIWACDLDLNLQYVSPSVENLLGWTPAEVIETGIARILTPDSMRLVTGKLQAAMQRHHSRRRVSDPLTFEIEQNRKDGETVWTEVSASLFVGDDGKVAGISGAYRDISERKKAEVALRQAKEDWERTFDGVPDLIAIIDSQHRIMRANRAMAQRLGLTPEECVGRLCYDRVHGESGAPAYCPHARSLTDGQEHAIEVHEERLGGDFLISCTPLFDDRGGRIGSVHVARDITGKKQAAEALRQSEEKFRSIFENTLIGIFQATLEGRYITANPALARIFGYESPEDLIASVTDIARQIYTDPADRDNVITGLKSSGKLERFLIKARRKDGSDIWVALNSRLVRDKDGAILFVEGMVEDITTRKRWEEALAESERFSKEIITHANEGVIVCDRDLQYVVWNRFMENLTGVNSQDVLGQRATDLFPHIREHGIEQLMRCALRGETASSADTPFQIPQTGKTGWVQSTYSPHVNARGEIVGVIGMIRDVTESKKAEDSLRQSERRLDLALKGSGLAFWDLNVRTGEAIFEERWAEILGYPVSELTSNLSAWQKSLHPDDLSRAMAELMDHLEGRKSEYYTEYRIRTRSGNWKWIADSGKTYEWDDEGKPLRAAGTHLDITERKQAEKALRESETRFRQLIENAPEGIFVQTRGRFAYLNNAALGVFGAHARDEIIGQPLIERIHSDYHAAVKERTRILNEEKRAVPPQDQVYLRLDGTLVDVSVSVVPMRYEGEDGALVFIRDITERKKAEKRLEEQVLFMDALMEAIPNPVFFKDIKGRSLGGNRAFEEFVGSKREDFVGKTVHDLSPTDLARKYHEMDLELIRNGEAQVYESQVQHTDGTRHDVIFSKAVYKGAGGQTAGLIGMIQDITDRKLAQEELLEAHNRLDQIIEYLPDPTFVIDANRNVIAWNRAIEQMTGISKAQMIGKGNYEYALPFYGERRPIIIDLALLPHEEFERGNYDTVHRSGDALYGEVYVPRTYGGEGAYLSATASRLRDASGNVIGAIETIRDITDRKKVEESLKQSEENYRSIFENAAEGIYQASIEGRFLSVNPAFARMFGYDSPEDAIHSIANIAGQFMEPADRRRNIEILEKNDVLKLEEFRLRCKDGHAIWCKLNARAVRDDAGKICLIEGMIEDITDRKKAEEALKESLAKREELEAIISQSPIVVVLYRWEKGYPIEYASPSVIQYGYEPEDFTSGRINLLDVVHPDDVDRVIEEARMNFQMGCDDITQDYRVRTAWGDYQWVLNRTRMRRDRKGRVTHGQSIIHDITDRKRAEIALQESERQMRALLDNIPDIVWLKDAESKFIAVNEPFGKTCGAKPDELVGKSDLDIWPKELAEAYRADDQEVMRSGRTKRVEEPLEDAHGNQKWIETIKTPIRNDRGNVIGTTGIARDVTERKRVEELYRMLSDKSLAGVYVVQDGVFKYLNANAASYAAYSPEDLVGSISTILLHPEDRAIAQQHASEMIRGVRQTPYEFRIIDKAGRVRWILETVTTIPYEGRPAVLGNSMDITQFKEAQQKLEELQALESSVLAAIPHAVIGIENRRVIFANDNVETVFGWKPAEIIGKDPAVFFSSQTDCDVLVEQIVRTLQNGTVYSAEPENPLVHREGRPLHCRVTAARICSGAGEGVVATVEDVTERKRAQLQILQSEKMASIGQLAAGVAHEINNPTGYVSSNLKTMAEYFDDIMVILQRHRQFLNGVRDLVEKSKLDGNLPGLMSEIEDMEKKIDIEYILKDAPSLIQESREGTERIKEIVLSLKNFAHPGEDRFIYSDVNKNMDSTLNVVWNELKYKATVNKEYGELPEVQCYPQQINQVFMNLLVNAAQAIKTKGEITIRTRSDNGEVEISIKDTGVGIPPEHLARVFDPFFTTKEVGKGTGLGLNVAYNIIKKHHGSIDVTSKVGEGTTFTIRLPVNQEEGKA